MAEALHVRFASSEKTLRMHWPPRPGDFAGDQVITVRARVPLTYDQVRYQAGDLLHIERDRFDQATMERTA